MPTVRPVLRPATTRAGAALATALLAAGLLTAAPTAHASWAEVTVEGASGQVVTVSSVTDLDPAGTDVRVTGTGFDESKGIYVALCVDNGEDARPTPCLGGVDMTGEGGSSGWISSNPPTYGKGVAVPFEQGGSFDVVVHVAPADANVDCRDAAVAPRGCVLATFADHTRISDRSADALVPVTFAAEGATPTQDPRPTQDPSTAPAQEPAPDATTPTSGTSATPTTEPSPPPATDAPAEDASSPEDMTRFWVATGLAALLAAVMATVAVRRVRAARAAEAASLAAPGSPDAGAPRTDGGADDDA